MTSVESEIDGDAWEARMESEGRDDADPHEDWETARERLIRLVCIATGHDPAEQLEAPISALTDDWLLVVSPGRDDPWDDEDADSRRLSVISRTKGLTIFSSTLPQRHTLLVALGASEAVGFRWDKGAPEKSQTRRVVRMGSGNK